MYRRGASALTPACPPQGSRPTRPHTLHTHYPRCPTPAAPTRAHRPSSAVSPVPFLSRLRTCTHRPLSRRFSRAVPLAPSHLRPPSLVPPFLPHLRPHRAHGATPHDRPDAPLSRRSPAPPARRASPTPHRPRPHPPYVRTRRTPRICTIHPHPPRAARTRCAHIARAVPRHRHDHIAHAPAAPLAAHPATLARSPAAPSVSTPKFWNCRLSVFCKVF